MNRLGIKGAPHPESPRNHGSAVPIGGGNRAIIDGFLEQNNTPIWKQWKYVRYLLICFFASTAFPITSLMLEASRLDLSFSWTGILAVHRVFYSQYLLNCVPIIITIIYYFFIKSIVVSKIASEIAKHFSQQYIEAKNDLEISMVRLTHILNNSPVAYVIVETSGRIAYANNAAELLVGSIKCIGLNVFNIKTFAGSLVENKLVSAMKGNVETLLHHGHTFLENGEKKFLNVMMLPQIAEDNSHVNEVFIMISDMTHQVQLRNELEMSYLNAVNSLAKALDARDKYTSNHSSNVRTYVELLAKTIMVEEDDIRNIAIAAELHDIGKIGVPDSILNKPGKLDEDELKVMRKHPAIGAQLLKDLDGYRHITDAILHHHECWDGSGYPDGLVGKDIPIGSQIIAIADFFDAVTTDRVYRKAMPYESAFDMLMDAKGTVLNPELVDFFISEFKHSVGTESLTINNEIQFTAKENG